LWPINLIINMHSISFVVNMEVISIFGPKHGSLISLHSSYNLFKVSKVTRFRRTLFPSNHAKVFRFKALTCDNQESNNMFKELPTSEWTHHFHSIQVDVSVSSYKYNPARLYACAEGAHAHGPSFFGN